MAFRLTRHRVLLVVLLVSMARLPARADSLAGAWTMTKYEGPGSGAQAGH